MIQNDANPSGGQPKKDGTQRNKRDWITKNMAKTMKLESYPARTDYNEVMCQQILRRH